MTKYQAGKEAARATAQEWQNDFTEYNICYWSELATISEYFEKLGRRYGLLTEFRENGII